MQCWLEKKLFNKYPCGHGYQGHQSTPGTTPGTTPVTTPGTTPEKETVCVDVSPSVYNVEDGKEESDGKNSNNSTPLVVNIDDEIILNQLNSQQSTPNSKGQLISERFLVVFNFPKTKAKI